MAGTLLQTKGMKSFGRYGAVGFELLLSIAVGYYGGRWLDGKLGTKYLALVGFLVGCYAGFRALFRVAKTMQKDIERDEAMARGEDPWADDYAAPSSPSSLDTEETPSAVEGESERRSDKRDESDASDQQAEKRRRESQL